MATSLSLENDSSSDTGYIKVNGSTAATLTTSGITGNLVGNVTGNADTATTATKLSTASGSAPSYACRAWVNFDGTKDTTGATSTANTNRLIRASGNVTSVLRNSAGDYTVTLTTAMSDSNYSISGSIRRGTTNDDAHFAIANGGLFSTTQVQVTSVSGGGYVDGEIISVQIFGN